MIISHKDPVTKMYPSQFSYIIFIAAVIYISVWCFVPEAAKSEEVPSVARASDHAILENHPFGNMLRKFTLLAQDAVKSAAQQNVQTSAPALESKPTTVGVPGVNPAASQGVAPSLPTTTISQPAIPAKQAPAKLESAPLPKVLPNYTGDELKNTADKNDYSLSSVTSPNVTNTMPAVKNNQPRLEEPQIEHPSEKSGVADQQEDKNVWQKLFEAEAKRQQESAKKKTNTKPTPPTPATPFSEIIPQNKYKKTYSETVAPDKKDRAKDVIRKNSEPSPVERPGSYKTQFLPDSISKKSYTKDNRHLPVAFYNEEYKKILFDSASVGRLDVLRAMIENFGDTEIPNEEGDTPLIYAVMAGNLESALTLISMGANVNAQNFNGVSALYAATKSGRIDIVKLLLLNAADTEIVDKNDKTPLMIACEMDFSTIARMIIKQGVNLDKRMRNGNTALHLATEKNSLASMNLLIIKGADIEIRNFNGYTPVMLAADRGQEQALALLIKSGADIYKTNAKSMDLQSIAKTHGYLHISELIDTEKIRQGQLEKELIEKKKKEILSEEIKNTLEEPAQATAKRVGGVPLPILRAEPKSTLVAPKPYFSPEEMQQMKF